MPGTQIIVDPELVRTGTHVMAVIRCHPVVDVLELRRALAGLDERVTLVALEDAGAPPGAVTAMARRAPPLATATPVTDALKRVSAGRIAGSVDRSSLVRAGLPMLLDVGRLRARIEALQPGTVPAGALLDPDADVRLLDRAPDPDERW